MTNTLPKVGDIQIDKDRSEWIVIGVNRVGVSRVRRNSLAHRVHAQSSPEIAQSYKEMNDSDESRRVER